MSYRYAASVMVGAGLFFWFFQPLLPYSQRSQLSLSRWLFPVAAFLCGFFMTLGAIRNRFWIPTALLLTLVVSNQLLFAADFAHGVDHNLFPIELIFVTMLVSPAYLGTLLSAAVDRRRARTRTIDPKTPEAVIKADGRRNQKD